MEQRIFVALSLSRIPHFLCGFSGAFHNVIDTPERKSRRALHSRPFSPLSLSLSLARRPSTESIFLLMLKHVILKIVLVLSFFSLRPNRQQPM